MIAPTLQAAMHALLATYWLVAIPRTTPTAQASGLVGHKTILVRVRGGAKWSSMPADAGTTQAPHAVPGPPEEDIAIMTIEDGARRWIPAGMTAVRVGTGDATT